MNDHEYVSILTALDAALAIFEAQPAHFGFELEAHERLRDIRDHTVAAQAATEPSAGA